MITLTNWALTDNSDTKGGKSGEAATLEPGKYTLAKSADDSLTFRAEVDDAKTSGTKYPRKELREWLKGKKAAWKLSQGGTMTASLTVDAVPTQKNGKPGKVVIGQIHGKSNELCRLYWNAGVVNFHNDISGKDHKEHEFTFPGLPKIPLGKPFSYTISATADTLTVTISLDGNTYSNTIRPVDKKWASDSLYFKAGVYLGNNVKQGAKGYGQATFTALAVVH